MYERQSVLDADRRSISSSTQPNDNIPSDLSNSRSALMFVAIVVPILFTTSFCFITYCFYRFSRKTSGRAPTNSSIASDDRSRAPGATVIYNSQHSPFVFEDSPPPYDSLDVIKKNSPSRTTNPYEPYPLTVLPNITLTNRNEDSATAVIPPTAPTPPPSYSNLGESNK